MPRRLKGKLTFLVRKDGYVSLPFDWIWDEMEQVLPDEPEDESASEDFSVAGNSDFSSQMCV